MFDHNNIVWDWFDIEIYVSSMKYRLSVTVTDQLQQPTWLRTKEAGVWVDWSEPEVMYQR